MTPRTRRQWIRDRASRFPPTLHASQGTRGVYTGQIAAAIKEAAGNVGVPVDSARYVRLRLASEVYEREIATFNQLSHAELWALHQWVILGDVATREIGDWLRANYGEQLSLLKEAA
jgi:hypothetical protein